MPVARFAAQGRGIAKAMQAPRSGEARTQARFSTVFERCLSLEKNGAAGKPAAESHQDNFIPRLNTAFLVGIG